MILFPKWTEVNEDIKKAPPIEGGAFGVYKSADTLKMFLS
jgi:hypothetical protein